MESVVKELILDRLSKIDEIARNVSDLKTELVAHTSREDAYHVEWDKDLKEIKEQTRKTNGRVNKNEEELRSLYEWKRTLKTQIVTISATISAVASAIWMAVQYFEILNRNGVL